MEYVIKITRCWRGQKYIHYFKTAHNTVADIKKAKRWKTKQGVENAIRRIPDIRFANVQNQWEIVAVKPVLKFSKKKLTEKDCHKIRNDIYNLLCKHGWTVNNQIKWQVEVDKNGKEKRSDKIHLIDPNERYSAVIKNTVITIHDGSRNFCKIISMEFNEMEIKKERLICGSVAFQI